MRYTQAKMSHVQTNPCYKMSFIGGVPRHQIDTIT